MRFLPTAEQADFTRTLDRMLGAAGTPETARAWAAGEHAPGRRLWDRLAEAGLFALAVPEAYDGYGPRPVELALAFVELGRHAVPGPVAETVAAAALLDALPDPGPAKEWLPRVATGRAVLTLAAPEGGHALDADAADAALLVAGDRLLLARGHGPVRASLDPARRLARPEPGTAAVLAAGPAVRAAAALAADRAALVTAAQALGVGLSLLTRTVGHVRRRRQFGVPVGSFQAVKHRLADTLIALEFARPLLHGAAVTGTGADIAAAKAACGEAAYTAARTALQLHGALGYTAEYELSLWLTKARALRSAWGSPAQCRARVLAETPV
ncbi:acyl-CoA dehydrogenase family protein [Streptomyces sp. NPDC026673]|uniref:acyl-CoA dehydrogenase family protein n=1 Tax=Streptomyces sp. NPDC026673 TaxID=3155724 RepID=UPI0034052A05